MFDMSQGLCRNEKDFDIFFPDDDGVYEPKTLQYAKSICVKCPVRFECRDEGIAEEAIGIWGGMTEKERSRYARGTDKRRVPEPGTPEYLIYTATNEQRAALAADLNGPLYRKGLDLFGVGMPNDVREVIQARLDNPNLSLSELGALLGVSKDDVAGKLRRVKSAVTTGKPINWSVGRPKR
jgi:hypothetical protein